MIFWKPLVCHCVKYDSFFHSVWNDKPVLTVRLSVLMENEDILNFHGSPTLNKGKVIGYSGNLLYAIVSNMTHFFILFGMRKKMACFALCVSSENEDIWNFQGSLNLNEGKLM